jgi:hypothetical protein
MTTTQLDSRKVDRTPRRKPRHWVARLILPLGGIVLALLFVELGLRAVAWLVPERYSWRLGLTSQLPLSYDQQGLGNMISSNEGLLRFDRDLGWSPQPSVDRSHINNNNELIRYQHDAAGLRVDPGNPVPPASRRILAFGDSFTYCEEVNFSDCWTQHLQAQLPGTEVLDYGVPAYAPDQAWLRYQREGRGQAPCAVLIGNMVENINRVVNRFRPFYMGDIPLAKPRFLIDNGQLQLLPSPAQGPEDLMNPVWVETNLGPHDAWYFPGTFVPNPVDSLQVGRVVRSASYRLSRWTWPWWKYQPGSEDFEVLSTVLVQFARQVRSDGATPVVLVFPYANEIVAAQQGRPKTHAPLLDLLAREGIATIDLTDALGLAARDHGVEELINSHYRPLGDAVVADALAQQLPDLIAPTCGPQSAPPA